MIGMIGLVAGLALLIWLALRDVNIIFASVVCALVVIVTNGLPFAESLTQSFTIGELGAFTFAGRFFLLFAAGAVFGKIMGDSHAATSIAMALVHKLGAHRTLWITVLACAVLTYGGVVVFVVIFAMYPLGLRLLKEANIPKRLFCGAAALGAGTFTLTALPGTPSIHNVIPTLTLGTDLFAAPLLGLFGGFLMFALGMAYLERERIKAQAAGEGFEPGPRDVIPDFSEIEKDVPHWALAIFPLMLVIATILAPRLAQMAGVGEGSALIEFATSQPVLWPSIALILASLVAIALFPAVRKAPLQTMGLGTQDAIMPLMATSAVIGFGGVVAQTSGFAAFTDLVVGSPLPPELSMFAAASTVSGITGSSSGGLQIFMATLAEPYLALGISPEELHRLVAMAAGGFDSLPHCGAVIAMLTITQLTHKQAYKEVGVVTVVVPVVATLATIALAMVT
ncbi:GntP family permease [Parerythrobacter jejuensis]|uniref:GntP family permease n=1 Tax=Parerythrobacter jejuensis TaxID=795812 RepID=A0A845AKE4_9SPHN|nr:GntP family permease [Parerythrobacter jejuensis]MXP31222.1 GntP family permease [Parerythrobacter jejuensis]MXP33982.1 GntP family permease [Parerythrobacter jejuensis]